MAHNPSEGEGSQDYPFIREVSSPITDFMVRPLDSRCQVVQWSKPLTHSDFRKLAAFMEKYPSVSLRVYDYHRAPPPNLDFLQFFPFVRKFKTECFFLDSLEGLRNLPPSLEYLVLGRTKKRFSLAVLRAFPHLRQLYLEGHQKDFETISGLVELEQLTLGSITLPDLSMLVPLRKLWSLGIVLGGTRNLQLLPSIGALKYLELSLIRGLSDISAIGEIESLQYLCLQQLSRVERLPSFRKLRSLRRVELEHMKKLHDLRPLVEASNIEEISLVNAGHMHAEDLKPLVGLRSLKRITMGLCSDRKNRAAAQMLPLPDAGLPPGGFVFR